MRRASRPLTGAGDALRRWRHKLFLVLGGGDGPRTPVARAFNIALMALILVNCVFSVLETVERFRVLHGRLFHDFDLISVAIFTLEYMLRAWTAVEMPDYRHPLWGRLRYLCTPLALVDLLAVLPFYLGFMFQIDLRELRVLRLLRLFKLGRYSQALSMMAAVLRQEAFGLSSILFLFLVLLVSLSSLMYLVEHPVQPTVFSDVPSALWWGVETMTTLGYGDMVPVTSLGRFLGGATALLGIGMIALPSGILASGFTEQIRLRRENYERDVDRTLKDGKLTARQRRHLEEARLALGLSHEEASQILETALLHRQEACPHCGKLLGPTIGGGPDAE